LSNDTLVSEILFSGEGDQGLDEGGVSGVGLDSGFDLSEWVLEFLDLNKGWVAQLGEEGKSIIDGSGGVVQFSDLSIELFMSLFSEEIGLFEGLSVIFLIFDEGVDSGLELGSSGNEEIVEGVFRSGDIDVSILDVLFVGQNQGIVFVGSDSEIEL